METKSLSQKALKNLVVGCSALFASVLMGAMPTLAASGPLNVSMFPIVNGGMQAAAGNAVTYVYQIWNEGDAPIANIRISDNQCALVTYDAVGQDLDVDHQLDKGELWSYYCQIIPTTTTLNVATVSGVANGVVIGASTSALVAIPGTTVNGGTTGGTVSGSPVLPNTGFGPAVKATRVHKANVTKTREASALVKQIGPQQLEIPAIGVNASVQAVGQTANGNMEAPKNGSDVTWFSTTLPGQSGNVVMAGHVDTPTSSQGVFSRLNQLRSGDDVYVTTGQQQKVHFVVNRNESYSAGSAPVQQIFGASNDAHLNLVTCDGAWDSRSHQYSKRRVVYTDLVRD